MRISTFKSNGFTPEERFKRLGPFATRHGMFPKGTVLPVTQVPACPRVKMSDLPKGHIPPAFYEKAMEHNQKANSCCRHPENHEIEARRSHPDEKAPDIYIFYCTGCGRKHINFCVGKIDRPHWEAD